MARQNGIIKLKGTIGGISFYKTSDGHLAREKGGVDKSRIAIRKTSRNWYFFINTINISFYIEIVFCFYDF